MATQYIHFTEEQKQTARQTDIAELLRRQGQTLKRSGSEYEWKNGSAKVTVRGNLWFHQYDHEGGDAIDFVRRLLAEGKLDPQRYKSVLMHRIDGGAALARFGAASKSRVDMGFLQQLFALGRRQGQQWAQDHRNDVGVRQTLQIVDNP